MKNWFEIWRRVHCVVACLSYIYLGYIAYRVDNTLGVSLWVVTWISFFLLMIVPEIKWFEKLNEPQEMYKILVREFPTARITLDEPLIENGVWALDVFLPNYHLAVIWQTDKGFGLVWDDAHGYGEGAQEIYPDLVTAFPRVNQLILGSLK